MRKNIALSTKPSYVKGEVFWRTKDSTLNSVEVGLPCAIPPMKLIVRKRFVLKV
jgi:hypothetical protein